MEHDMKIYFMDTNDAELTLFELVRNSINYYGPTCECGGGCELDCEPTCKEVFLSANSSDREEIVILIIEEADVTDFRIEVEDVKETATSARKEKEDYTFDAFGHHI